MMEENHQTLRTVGMSGDMSSGLTGLHEQNLYPQLINVEGEYEREENDIQQVEIHLTSSAELDQEEDTNVNSPQQIKEEEIPLNISEELHDYNLQIVTIKEEREYEGEENDIQQTLIHADACAGSSDVKHETEQKDMTIRDFRQIKEEEINLNTNKGGVELKSSILLKVDQEEKLNVKIQQDVKEEEIPMNISESGSMSKNIASIFHGNSTLEENKAQEELTKDLNSRILMPHYRQTPSDETDECSEYNKNYLYYMSHSTMHTNEKLFTCSECGKCFTWKSNLIIHKRIHTGEKPFSCSECGKCFTQKSNLISHQRIHTGEKPFACSECGESFSMNISLVSHQIKHTGEKPFICSECGKCFSRKTTLDRHLKSHKGEKPFSCSECGKCFIQNSDLVRHQKTHR
ncbi:uncharacterized protein O3C94_013899 [Discoglossus pictus]